MRRCPYGDLPRASGATGQHQAGDVGTGDQQHHGDDAEQGRGADADRTQEALQQRVDPGRGGLVDRALLRQTAVHAGQVLARPLQADAGPQASDPLQVEAARVLLGGGSQGDPEVGVVEERGLRRHHPDDGVGLGIQPHRPAEHVGIGVEAVAPQVVSQQGHRGRAGRVVLGAEATTEEWLDAEDLLHVVRHLDGVDADGVGAHGQVDGLAGPHGHALEGRVVSPPGNEVRVGDGDVIEVPLRRDLVEADQPLRLGKGKRLEEQAVEDAEDDGVTADSQRQHSHHQQGEERLSSQAPQGKTGVADQLEPGRASFRGRVPGGSGCPEGLVGGAGVGSAASRAWASRRRYGPR